MSVDTDTAAPSVHARATVRPDKAATVAELAEAFRASSAAVLTEYRGLTVKQISALRVALGADTSYAVVKNTLTKIAANDVGLEGVDALLTGPTAVAFINGEPVEAAKALRDFARTNPALVVKGGVMDGKALTADEVRRLADLESREVLLAKMAGALLASLSGAVRLFAEPLAKTARLAGALEAKATEDPSVLRGGAGTPAPAAEPDPAPAEADAVTADGAADAVAADTSPETSSTPA
ncbi:MAG: LSU ribosomal protein L10p (P0) [uncultured Nocardioidaceae bacterium]|uniref:Large ribosomal subunit protein uL10 n=1 Tax=uncultured Nocardioidaceae bacterium TaxID=253824 RepID=A0A6J4ML84_9ACTN|nr:MAG: LSU ribosomal protein L10p (P0) [uncultured Nocardioidaceae bacterium]